MKKIQIIFENDIWEIPLSTVAMHKAVYYAQKKDNRDAYEKLFKDCLQDEEGCLDWLQNNMDFNDFENVLTIRRQARINKMSDRDWQNAAMNVTGEN